MMSPLPEVLAVQSLEDFRARRARGDLPRAEDYLGLPRPAYEEFLAILDVDQRLEGLLEPSLAEPLPREFGRFTLLRELGRGAMGVVYEARDRDLNRLVALKILHPGRDTADAVTRFRDEARSCAEVSHEHVVKVYEPGVTDGRHFYAMELVSGTPLSRYPRAGTPEEIRALCRALAGVADALHALHEGHVIHRDVKPSNIIVRPDGRMVLVDFGLARHFDEPGITASGQSLGTLLYMSPEQLRGKRDEVDGRSDVYSLGATMYEVLAGRRLFPSTQHSEVMHCVLDVRPDPLGRVALHVPVDIENVVMKALEKRREDRYASAAEMRDDLLAYAEGRVTTGRPVSTLRRGLRAVRRRAIPLAAVLLVAAGAFAWFTNRPGHVLIATIPQAARISFDGKVYEGVPVDVDIGAGTYVARLEAAHFAPVTLSVPVAPGGRYENHEPLRPIDQEGLLLLTKGYGFEPAPLTDLSGPRSMPSALKGVRVLFPQGRVRLGDLKRCAYEVGSGDLPPGRIEWRLGDRRLHAEPLGENSRFEGKVPSAVLSALTPGDVVEWGFFPETGSERWTATFTVVAEDPALTADLGRVAKSAKALPPDVRSYLSFLALRKAGLLTAALQEAEATSPEESRGPLGWAVVREALIALGIEDCAMGTKAWTAIDGLPEAERAAWFPDAPLHR